MGLFDDPYDVDGDGRVDFWELDAMGVFEDEERLYGSRDFDDDDDDFDDSDDFDDFDDLDDFDSDDEW